MIAVILAAGYATRLYPLTVNKPKCLLTVGGETILDHILKKLSQTRDLREVVIVTNAKFFPQLEAWKSQTTFSKTVRILNDGTTSNDNRLGAIGDLGLAIRQLAVKEDILLLASDNLFDQNLDEFIAYARLHPDAPTAAIYDLGRPEFASKKFGVVEASREGRVLTFEEKPEQPRTSLIGMGLYFFPAKTLSWVDEYLHGEHAQDAPGHYLRWILQKSALFSFLFTGMWYDIGDLKALEEANAVFKSHQTKKAE